MSNLDHSLQAAADFGELHHLRLEPLSAPVVEQRGSEVER